MRQHRESLPNMRGGKRHESDDCCWEDCAPGHKECGCLWEHRDVPDAPPQGTEVPKGSLFMDGHWWTHADHCPDNPAAQPDRAETAATEEILHIVLHEHAPQPGPLTWWCSNPRCDPIGATEHRVATLKRREV